MTPWRLSRAATIELGYSFFKVGDRGAALGLGASGRLRHWIYLQSRIGV